MVDNNKDDGLVPPGKEKCHNCGGFGKKYGKECDVCHGEGFIPEGSADSSRDSIFPMATRKTLAQVNAANRRRWSRDQGAFEVGETERPERKTHGSLSKDIDPTSVKVGGEYWDKYNQNWITVTAVTGYEVRGKTESGKSVTVSASQLTTEEV
jgi:hypothetical protein